MRHRRARTDIDDLIGDPDFKPAGRIDDLIPRRSLRAKSCAHTKVSANLPRVIGPRPSDAPQSDERFLVGMFWLQTRFRSAAQTVRHSLAAIRYVRTYRQGSGLWELKDAAPKLMRGRFAHLDPEDIQRIFDEDKTIVAPKLENAIWGANIKKQKFVKEASKLFRKESVEAFVREYYKIFTYCIDKAILEV